MLTSSPSCSNLCSDSSALAEGRWTFFGSYGPMGTATPDTCAISFLMSRWLSLLARMKSRKVFPPSISTRVPSK